MPASLQPASSPASPTSPTWGPGGEPARADRSPGNAAVTLMCGEVSGGNEPTLTSVALPGLTGTLYSRPCHGARGGDVHYLSVCGAGIVARVCVADVAGHGEMVAKVGSLMHAELRRSVDTIDERRVFSDMDQRLAALGTKAMTTAALLTYYPPGRRLTFSYAGHPPGWLWRRRDRAWTRLLPEENQTAAPFQGLPLGTGFDSSYTRRRIAVDVGDRIVLVTDGVLEAPRASDDEQFGAAGVEAALNAAVDQPCEQISAALTDAVRAHAGDEGFNHDDITTFVGEFVPGPAGPVMWHVLKNRYLGRLLPRR